MHCVIIIMYTEEMQRKEFFWWKSWRIFREKEMLKLDLKVNKAERGFLPTGSRASEDRLRETDLVMLRTYGAEERQ